MVNAIDCKSINPKELTDSIIKSVPFEINAFKSAEVNFGLGRIFEKTL